MPGGGLPTHDSGEQMTTPMTAVKVSRKSDGPNRLSGNYPPCRKKRTTKGIRHPMRGMPVMVEVERPERLMDSSWSRYKGSVRKQKQIPRCLVNVATDADATLYINCY